MNMKSRATEFSMRLDNNPVHYPVKLFKCGYETIFKASQDKWIRNQWSNLTFSNYGQFYARNVTGFEDYHTVEVRVNDFNMEGPSELNKMVFDLTTFYDVFLPINNVNTQDTIDFCTDLYFEIYESSLTHCANYGGSCTSATCPWGSNMYYGVNMQGQATPTLERDSKYIKILTHEANYTTLPSGLKTFLCNDASFYNVDPLPPLQAVV